MIEITSLVLGIIVGIFITEISLLLAVKLFGENEKDTKENKKNVD